MANPQEFADFIELHRLYGDRLPIHVGLIPDGNRRWIKRQGIKDSLKGHLAGYEVVKEILMPCYDAGIKYLTLYALSTENVRKRSKFELSYLYKLLQRGVEEILNDPLIIEKQVCVQVFGRVHELPADVQAAVKKVTLATRNHTGCFLNLCVNYDGQEEIVDAVKSLLADAPSAQSVSKALVKTYLYSKGFPEIDYIIRTGMEDGARFSGFMLWDVSYSEFRFRKELWPDYTKTHLMEDLTEYIRRNRRKGA
ncbi:MAG: di-trans,poly-cis-decaprenylcistransferase [Candidatus Heimdallarchaeota archaeon]|nr:di-trans,poly-cis-decaprenylcistransferase [Candidatus Heimdallarchaeota archaeon]